MDDDVNLVRGGGKDTPFVRFLIENQEVRFGLQLRPWHAYNMPLIIADRTKLPYEVMPGSDLRVGTRLAGMIKGVGFKIRGGGGCCGCSAMETLLNVADIDWIKLHKDELIEAIRDNAEMQEYRVPKRLIWSAVMFAVILERRRVRQAMKKAKERARMRMRARGPKRM